MSTNQAFTRNNSQISLALWDNSKFNNTDLNHSDNSENINSKEEEDQTSSTTKKVQKFFKNHQSTFITGFKLLLLAIWILYLICACYLDFTNKYEEEKNNHMKYPSLPLLAVTVISFIFMFYNLLKDFLKKPIKNCSKRLNLDNLGQKYRKFIFIGIFLGFLALSVLAIGLIFVLKTSKQWVSLSGYVIIPIILVILSAKPKKIKIRPVIGGLLIQLIFAIFITTEFGSQLFEYLGGLAQTILNFVEDGYIFLFGEEIVSSAPFAFTVLPICIYISSVVGVLYYLGAMEWVIKKIGFLMYSVLRTSATESMVASGNIFIGQSEAPLLIRPYLKDCTDSELLAIMAAGMGTVAGSTLGAYINFGVDPVYVITASFMAAPTVLALSKIIFPETEKSKFKNFDEMKCEQDETIGNVVDAAARGATDAVSLVANIAACLIAFMSIARAINELLSQLGRLIGFFDPLITLDLIFSYVFYPISFILGVDDLDLFKVSALLGKKLVINEFIAYEEMTSLQPFRATGCLRNTFISKRSEAICTYALCGFANISSMAITLGGLGPMAPTKRTNMSKLVFRALIAGTFTSFMNAALTGFLGRVSYDVEIENEEGFYVDCRNFCCAYVRNNNALVGEESYSYCSLEEPDAEYGCYEKCREYDFSTSCTISLHKSPNGMTYSVFDP